jgi:hypothetical protein
MRAAACVGLLAVLLGPAVPSAAGEPDLVAFSALGFVSATQSFPGGSSTCDLAPLAVSFAAAGDEFVFEQTFAPDAISAATASALCADLPAFSHLFSNRVPPVTDPCLGGHLQAGPDTLAADGSLLTITNHFEFCDGTNEDQTTVLFVTPLWVTFTQDFVDSAGSRWHAEGVLDNLEPNPAP